MKWVAADIEMYQKAAEYVDTAIIPLMPVSFDSDMKQSASMAEFIGILTGQLEKQFKGRIFLLPAFVYIKGHSGNLKTLQEWEKTLLDKQFKHLFFVTSDSSWRQQENEMSGTLLWLPSLPLEHMQDQQKVSIVEDQVKQLLTLFTEKWEQEE
ncbi:YpiF family protein [Heyndrickxia sp. MSNUG]|uniref:YpiF family protein n=1 Tax=Heyndrickxia sp. MSNUG TaxID=3136677 RepID=UPI003C2B620A